jgi:hypothetical protein
MLGSRNLPKPRWLAACGVTWLCLSGCSGKEFATSDAIGGTSSSGGTETGGKGSGGSASGATAGADTAGEATTGGKVTVGGAGGAGGVVSTGCVCPADHYCRDGTQDCFDCAEFNRLHFTTPERMSTLSDNGQGSHFPRVGSTGTDLLYHFDGTGLRYTADASTSAGSSVTATVASDSGPLLLGGDVTSVPSMTMMGFNFLFDRTQNGLRSIQIGQWKNGLQKFEKAPVPWNGDKSDYSVAVALKPTADGIARAFWMTNRNVPKPELVTALLAPNAPVAPVGLQIGQTGCMASDADLTPWVTADGKALLTSHTRMDANCQPSGQLKDIYTAVLPPATGLPTVPAVPINDINSPMNDTEPSFSADMCDLYFASDRDGKYALYRAHRR